MFVGHAALAFAAKRASPGTSLGTLVAASFAIDLLWPVLLLAGVERVRIDPGNTAFTPLAFDAYPWSHSLAMVLVWSVLAAALTGAATRKYRPAWVVGLLVLSHRALDRTGTAAFVPFVLFSGAVWIAGPFSPPPPSAASVAVVGLALWLLPPWAAWFDRHRAPRDAAPGLTVPGL